MDFELKILDENFELIGDVVNFKSFIWTRRYYEHGIFELHCDEKYFEMLNSGKYLYRNDREEIAVIRMVVYKETSEGKQAYCKGDLGESILNERVIDRPFKMNATPEEISRGLIQKYICEPDTAARRVEHISLGEMVGFGEKVQKQVTGDAVGEACYDIEKTQEMSHRLRYDFMTNEMYFEVWQGKDRREEQTDESWAIFSHEFLNVKSVEYQRDARNYANYAYVAGEGDGEGRMVVEVDVRTDPEEERREIYVDARDLQNEIKNEMPFEDGTLSLDPEYQYTDEEYEELLRQRGLEKLAEKALIENLSGDISSNINLRYMEDYDLGDYVTFKLEEIGVAVDTRITEIQEVYEGVAMKLKASLGQDTPTSIRKFIKQEVG